MKSAFAADEVDDFVKGVGWVVRGWYVVNMAPEWSYNRERLVCHLHTPPDCHSFDGDTYFRGCGDNGRGVCLDEQEVTTPDQL